jgi:hypothetical protein
VQIAEIYHFDILRIALRIQNNGAAYPYDVMISYEKLHGKDLNPI